MLFGSCFGQVLFPFAVFLTKSDATTTVGCLPGFDESVLSGGDGDGEVDDSESLVEAENERIKSVLVRGGDNRWWGGEEYGQDEDLRSDRDGKDVTEA